MSELVAQLLWNGLVSGALIALVALGLTLIYGIAGFIQFAHGEMVALGAYSFLVFHKVLDWEIFPSAFGAVWIVVGIGLVLEKLFFKPVRDHDPMTPLVMSIGLSIGIQALILIFFGAKILTISDHTFASSPLFWGKVLATSAQIYAIILSLILMSGLMLFLYKTKQGKAIRATASNRNLSKIFGINVDTSMKWIFGVGAGLAAIAGILLGFEQNLEPTMGVMMSLKAFSAVVLGAVGSVRGTIFGAFLIGLSESLLIGLGIIPSGFSAAIPFVVLIGMLLIRPQGLFGKRFELLRQ